MQLFLTRPHPNEMPSSNYDSDVFVVVVALNFHIVDRGKIGFDGISKIESGSMIILAKRSNILFS